MINATHKLSLTRQAELLELSRASLYYQPVPVSEADLRLMRRIDQLHLELPFLGSRMLRDLLVLEGFSVGRKHVATLMRKMGLEAIYRRRNASRRHPQHPVFPYLLRHLDIDRPNQVWAADVTYIPCATSRIGGRVWSDAPARKRPLRALRSPAPGSHLPPAHPQDS
jgi:putative transposase